MLQTRTLLIKNTGKNACKNKKHIQNATTTKKERKKGDNFPRKVDRFQTIQDAAQSTPLNNMHPRRSSGKMPLPLLSNKAEQTEKQHMFYSK